MSSRAYVLINVAEGKTCELRTALQRKPGITRVDCVDGPPDIVMIAEAEELHKLASLTIKALTSIEHLTSYIQCLPVSGGGDEYTRVRG